MKKVKIYQYSKCGTCRDAVKQLKRNGYELDSVEIFEHPPNPQELAVLIKNSGMPLFRFFNTSGEVYREMNLKDKVKLMSEDEQLALLSSNGRLIKRPIVTDGTKTTVGYKAETYDQVWR